MSDILVPPPDDPRLDAALDAYARVPAPSGFTARTMARIAAEAPVARRSARSAGRRPRPIGWLDVLVPLVVTTSLVVAVTAAWWSLGAVNPLWAAGLRLDAHAAALAAARALPPATVAFATITLGAAAVGMGMILVLFDGAARAAGSARGGRRRPA